VAKDYYEILGVSKNASQDEIQAAYRRLVMQYHPDINKAPDATKKMAEINEAYDTLSDPEKRRKYDMYGQAGAGADFGSQQAYYNREDFGDFFSGGGFGGSIFDDLINSFFGGRGGEETVFTRGRTSQTSRKGSDIAFEVEINLEDAISGKEIEAEIERYEKCEECGGTGAKKGTKETTCPTCKGSGRVNQVQNTIFGSFRNIVTCPECSGKGKIIKEKCDKCVGTGRVKKRRKIKLEIPKAVVDGTRIRYKGMGNAGEQGGEPGDLYLYVKIKPHPIYQRNGSDLIYRAKISFPQAVLGTTITVPTPYGKESLKIPPGTNSGKEFIIQGKGLPYPGNINKRGNFIVKIEIDIPDASKLNKEAKKLIEELNKNI
jgi:molecular chaperone DnaJ